MFELPGLIFIHRLRAAARYSGTTPSMILTLALPRIDKARAVSGVSPESMDMATSAAFDRAETFGDVGAVAMTKSAPVQKYPTGMTRGVPSSPT
jgi:hypothetical protein